LLNVSVRHNYNWLFVYSQQFQNQATAKIKLGHSFRDSRDGTGGFRNRIGTGLHHSVWPDKKFSVWIDGKPVEQSLQFGPQPVAAEGCDRVKLAHVRLLCVWDTIGGRRCKPPDYRLERFRAKWTPVRVKKTRFDSIETEKALGQLSLVITLAQKERLRDMGFSDEQIANMTPEQAHKLPGIFG
jgi:hypothetical protein